MQEQILKTLDGYRIIDVRNVKVEATTEKIVALCQRNNVLPAGTDPYQRAN